ncbi:hypothetical protein CVT26_005081 [Gymnopilus dilepis]|uniref:BPL/LPL catalytic domain-containing protein n=1 Tax=Gymnopilus dilepis TaxID=231916 RepID=A0A409Y0A1_9AGAR|nr:hypothetical protein CVT26_005081 [Gymnopilus dilepis]
MNVLVYSGPEILQTSLNHALGSLRTLLLPHYTVQPITLNALTTQPWQSSCALLVMPRLRHQFVSVASKYIQDFVEAGGAYLMLGIDATIVQRSRGLGFGQTELTFGSETNEISLKFYDKSNDCYVTFEGQDIKNHTSPRLVTLRTSDGSDIRGVYDEEAAAYKGFESLKGTTIIAHYQEKGKQTIASLVARINKGRVALWGPSIEYPLTEEPASSLIASEAKLSADDVRSADRSRIQVISSTLARLGLQLPQEDKAKQVISRPLPQFLTATPSKPTIVSEIADAIAAPQSGMQLTTLKDANDEFHFRPLEESEDFLKEARDQAQISSDPSTWQPKHIILCRNGTLPSRQLTPLFDLAAYYRYLSAAREQETLLSAEPWGVGEALMYGEAVTSTQTMLDKNPHLLSHLPTPLLSLASHQLAGRGRGSNIWLSPSGCLQFSLLLRVSLSSFPATKLVFLQYLFALAVVEACRDEKVLGPKAGDKIRLKWPNDIYALVGTGKEDVRKVGGILVNTSFFGGKIDIVIGCGLNILNPPPITSLSQLQSDSQKELSMEQTAALIMAKFESMWKIFIREKGSFEPFLDLYLRRWLHSDQLVTLTTMNPHKVVRIEGITLDHGLLRTIPERSGIPSARRGDDVEYIDLQPDGNSFDLMLNLIKSKT